MVAGAVLATVGSLPLSSVLAHVVQRLRSGLSKRTVRVEINGDVLVLDGVNDETQQRADARMAGSAPGRRGAGDLRRRAAPSWPGPERP